MTLSRMAIPLLLLLSLFISFSTLSVDVSGIYLSNDSKVFGIAAPVSPQEASTNREEVPIQQEEYNLPLEKKILEAPNLPPKVIVEENASAQNNNASVVWTNLTMLRHPVDYENYTIRINTWNRPVHLALALVHYSTCEGVAQIQVVWCEEQGEPPQRILDIVANKSDKIVLERHAVNSLNERFNILFPSPTLGIFSIDDDVLRPCEALDSGTLAQRLGLVRRTQKIVNLLQPTGFFKWTRHPDRMVGYDGRGYKIKDNKWKVCSTESWMMLCRIRHPFSTLAVFRQFPDSCLRVLLHFIKVRFRSSRLFALVHTWHVASNLSACCRSQEL